jgi:hypothetical protein
MLFFYEGEFVEVIRENTYESVLTLCSNNVDLLTAITSQSGTMAEPVELHNQNHKWALHLPDDRSIDILKGISWRDIEKVERITGEPVAYAYDYIRESEANKTEGSRWGDYGYCWPEEIERTRASLFECDDPADGEVIFVPIWTTPNELTGAPREPINWEVEDGDDDE